MVLQAVVTTMDAVFVGWLGAGALADSRAFSSSMVNPTSSRGASSGSGGSGGVSFGSGAAGVLWTLSEVDADIPSRE